MQGHMIAFQAAMTRKGEMEKRKQARDAELPRTQKVPASR